MNGVLGCDSALVRLNWAGIIWADEMNIFMNHAPGEGLITQTIDQQSIWLPLCHSCRTIIMCPPLFGILITKTNIPTFKVRRILAFCILEINLKERFCNILRLNGYQIIKGDEISRVLLTIAAVEWAEDMAVEWSEWLTRDDLLHVRDFFKKGMDITVMEEKVR